MISHFINQSRPTSWILSLQVTPTLHISHVDTLYTDQQPDPTLPWSTRPECTWQPSRSAGCPTPLARSTTICTAAISSSSTTTSTGPIPVVTSFPRIPRTSVRLLAPSSSLTSTVALTLAIRLGRRRTRPTRTTGRCRTIALPTL